MSYDYSERFLNEYAWLTKKLLEAARNEDVLAFTCADGKEATYWQYKVNNLLTALSMIRSGEEAELRYKLGTWIGRQGKEGQLMLCVGPTRLRPGRRGRKASPSIASGRSSLQKMQKAAAMMGVDARRTPPTEPTEEEIQAFSDRVAKAAEELEAEQDSAQS